MCGCAAGITLNTNLFETVLRDLLVERAEFTVQIYEGTGAQWRKAKCGACQTAPHACLLLCALGLRAACPTGWVWSRPTGRSLPGSDAAGRAAGHPSAGGCCRGARHCCQLSVSLAGCTLPECLGLSPQRAAQRPCAADLMSKCGLLSSRSWPWLPASPARQAAAAVFCCLDCHCLAMLGRCLEATSAAPAPGGCAQRCQARGLAGSADDTTALGRIAPALLTGVGLMCREALPGRLGPLEEVLFRRSKMANARAVIADCANKTTAPRIAQPRRG